MPTCILVTAATGKVSSRVVKLLIESGGDVRVMAGVRNFDKAKQLADIGAHLVPFDFNDSSTIEAAIAGIDKIFLLTPGMSEMTREAVAALSAAESAGTNSIVRLSAIGADADPGITLTQLHRSVERALQGSGITHTVLRPNGFMQNFEMNAATIKAQNAFYSPEGVGPISWIDADDIAAVAARVLLDTTGEYDGKTYELTGPESLDSHQIAAIFSRVLGREINYVPISFEDAEKGMASAGMPPALIEVLSELYRNYEQIGGSIISNAVPAITGRSGKTFEQYVQENRALFE